MAQDARLDLGRYLTNPFNRQGQIPRKLNFNDLFRAKPETGAAPWNNSRFTETDLINRLMSRKETLNPTLNFVSNSPFFDDNEKVTSSYEMFDGLGRFERPVSYDFDEGRPRTKQRPQDQPDYDPRWIEAYNLSPTLRPEKAAKNPMPRLKNPDPNGILMKKAQGEVKSETENTPSVAQLLERQSTVSAEQAKAEEEEGAEAITKEDTNVSPGKTIKVPESKISK
jgi:hypothetical protein